MMKWLRFFLLLGVVTAVGCSKGPAGTGKAPPKTPGVDEKVDMNLEKAAAKTGK